MYLWFIITQLPGDMEFIAVAICSEFPGESYGMEGASALASAQLFPAFLRVFFFFFHFVFLMYFLFTAK